MIHHFKSSISETWSCNGKYHRIDGPAVITASASYWYKHGYLHREDGPAVVSKWGEEYWLEGKEYSLKKYHEIMTMRHGNDLSAAYFPAWL